MDFLTAHELLRYEPKTGKFFWRKRAANWFKTERQQISWNQKNAGEPAFTTHFNNGYRSCVFEGRVYLAHRVAWLMQTGEWPTEIDHINRVRSDNRWENMRNLPLQKNNTSGASGVFWCKEKKKWRARIHVDGRWRSLGRFSRFEDAIKARQKAQRAAGFHPNHGKP